MNVLDAQEIEQVSGAVVNRCDVVAVGAVGVTAVLVAATVDAARFGLGNMALWTGAGAVVVAAVGIGAAYASGNGWGVCAPVSGWGGGGASGGGAGGWVSGYDIIINSD